MANSAPLLSNTGGSGYTTGLGEIPDGLKVPRHTGGRGARAATATCPQVARARARPERQLAATILWAFQATIRSDLNYSTLSTNRNIGGGEMPAPPFRETYTLSDAVELVGRHLFGDTWSSLEYIYCEGSRGPAEVAAERQPLESELTTVEAQIDANNRDIGAILDAGKIGRLKRKRGELEARENTLRARLRNLPYNETTIENYNAYLRWHKAKQTLLDGIRQLRLKVHDGRGRELNFSVWNDPRFRYYIDLSIVVNSRTAGGLRRQAARIDRDAFKNWLATVKPLVESPGEPAVEERLTEFVRREVDASRNSKRKTKPKLLELARNEIPGVTKRMFERVWGSVTPADWHKPGAPSKN